MIVQAIGKLADKKDLTGDEIAGALTDMADGVATAAQVGAFLLALRVKGETAEEIAGAARVVRARAKKVRVDAAVFVDTCGTGGDGADTFNISTGAAILAAACGVTVAKHGNRSVSSQCGSADVLQALGVKVDADIAVIERCIVKAGVGFLFAPALHPAFGAVAAVRRELKVRTLFNLLGPLANPAGARHQVLGVYSVGLVHAVGKALAGLETQHALVVHGGGLDEISVSGPTTACEVRGTTVIQMELTPAELGLETHPLSSLKGGSPERNAQILRDVFSGQKGGPRDAVLANAAAALVVGGLERELAPAVRRAAKALDDGSATRCLATLVRESQLTS